MCSLIKGTGETTCSFNYSTIDRILDFQRVDPQIRAISYTLSIPFLSLYNLYISLQSHKFPNIFIIFRWFYPIHLGVSIVMGVPPNGWFIMEHPHLKWMRTGGTPVSGKLHFPLSPSQATCHGHCAGPGGATINDIRQKAGSSSATVERWFPAMGVPKIDDVQGKIPLK